MSMYDNFDIILNAFGLSLLRLPIACGSKSANYEFRATVKQEYSFTDIAIKAHKLAQLIKDAEGGKDEG